MRLEISATDSLLDLQRPFFWESCGDISFWSSKRFLWSFFFFPYQENLLSSLFFSRFFDKKKKKTPQDLCLLSYFILLVNIVCIRLMMIKKSDSKVFFKTNTSKEPSSSWRGTKSQRGIKFPCVNPTSSHRILNWSAPQNYKFFSASKGLPVSEDATTLLNWRSNFLYRKITYFSVFVKFQSQNYIIISSPKNNFCTILLLTFWYRWHEVIETRVYWH